MSTIIYGGTSFQIQLDEAINTFLYRKQKEKISLFDNITNDIIDSYIKFKTRPSDYFLFDFHKKNLSDEARDSFVTDTFKDSSLIKYDGWENYLELSDKYGFYLKAKEYFHRAVMFVDSSTPKEKLFQFVLESKDLFVKPNSGSYGKGAFVAMIYNKDDANKLYETLMNFGGSWLIEQRIIQDNDMAKWNPSSVNTIRFTSMFNHGKFYPLTPVLRVGRLGNVVDNGGSGGILANIDVNTGMVYTDGLDENGNSYIAHPDTGVIFKGAIIPHWDRLLQTVESIHTTICSNHKYVGWDFSLNKDGQWVLIEGNWGQFLNQYVDKIGRKQEFVEMLKD